MWAQPFNNIMITNSSFMDPGDGQRALLFPSFKSVLLPDVSDSTVEQFIQSFLLPETLHPMHDALSTSQKKTLTRVRGALTPPGSTTLQNPLILICGHNSRDSRCGAMGPLLRSEFVRHLNEVGVKVSTNTVHPEEERSDATQLAAHVGLISHIGGHKWAGNVIIYLPPEWGTDGKVMSLGEQKPKLSPLAGCGVWYGRVEPKHVEGIMTETLLGGRVIKELFRGGIRPNSDVIRLPLEK
jgi:(2Fe-2S) ferredoxin